MKEDEHLIKVVADLSDRTMITVEDFARLVGIGRSTAYSLAKRGEFPVRRLGGRLFVPVPALRRWLGVDPEDDLTPAPEDRIDRASSE